MRTKSALLPAVPKVLGGWSLARAGRSSEGKHRYPMPILRTSRRTSDPGAHATSRIAQPSPSAGVAGSILQAFRRARVVQEPEDLSPPNRQSSPSSVAVLRGFVVKPDVRPQPCPRGLLPNTPPHAAQPP